VIGNPYFDHLVASAPVNFDTAKVDWAGISTLLNLRGISPSGVVAVSWCAFSAADLGAQAAEPVLAMVHHEGVLSSTGRPATFGGPVKFHQVDFAACRCIIEAETAAESGYGTCGIEFLGTREVLLGRLQWTWRARRFRDSRAIITAAASERDRIMKVVKALAL